MPIFYVLMGQYDYEGGSPLAVSLDRDELMRDVLREVPSHVDYLEIYAVGDDEQPRFYFYKEPLQNHPTVRWGEWGSNVWDEETGKWRWTPYDVPPSTESRRERLLRWAEQLMNESQSCD